MVSKRERVMVTAKGRHVAAVFFFFFFLFEGSKTSMKMSILKGGGCFFFVTQHAFVLRFVFCFFFSQKAVIKLFLF